MCYREEGGRKGRRWRGGKKKKSKKKNSKGSDLSRGTPLSGLLEPSKSKAKKLQSTDSAHSAPRVCPNGGAGRLRAPSRAGCSAARAGAAAAAHLRPDTCRRPAKVCKRRTGEKNNNNKRSYFRMAPAALPVTRSSSLISSARAWGRREGEALSDDLPR